MKKLLKSLVVATVTASMLLTNISGAFAMALEGEVMKQIDYKYGNDVITLTKKVNIVVPKELENVDVYPNKVMWNGFYVFEDEIINGKIYKWAKTAEENKARDILDEFVLMEYTGNPYYEPDETKRIDYGNKYDKVNKGYVYSELNHFYGKDATNLKVYIDGTLRTFSTAFYPKRCLINHAGNIYGADARIPMVGIREFVNSVPYMDLVWDNGRIIVSNSKTGKTTVFNIYTHSSDPKAIMIDNSTYASLDELLIAQFGLEDFVKHLCIPATNTRHLAYYKIGNSLEESLGFAYEAYSNVGCLSSFLTETLLPQNMATTFTGTLNGMQSWVPYNKEGSLKVLNMLETKVNPTGCIYAGDVSPTFVFGDANADQTKIDTSKYSTVKAKVDAIAKNMKNSFASLDNANSFSLNLSKEGIPSVIINGQYKDTGRPNGLCGYNVSINGVYCDGAWYYYDLTKSQYGVTKDKITNTFFADSIWGIYVADTTVSEQEKAVIMEWSKRYSALGYSTFN